MDEDLAQAAAFGVFVVLIGVEWIGAQIRARRRGESPGFPFHDSLTNLSIGLGSVVVGGIAVLPGVWTMQLLDEHVALFELPSDSIAVWIAITLGVDFCFYWSHRAMHRVNLLWTIHATHHQGDQFNLLLALRISWFSVCFSWLFYLPLTLLGVKLWMIALSRALSSMYQFTTHTRLVGKLGVIDRIFNTPSNHRVHHGIEPKYLDKNHGGLLMIWDRMFGTYAPEDEEPTYGTGERFTSFNPVWSNVVEVVRLAQLTRATRRLRDKLQLWLRPPEWLPEDLRDGAAPVLVPVAPRPVFDRRTPRSLDVYLAINFVLVLGAAVLSLLYTHRMTPLGTAVIGVEVVVAAAAWGALIEGRRWGWWLEWARLVSIVAIAGFAPSLM